MGGGGGKRLCARMHITSAIPEVPFDRCPGPAFSYKMELKQTWSIFFFWGGGGAFWIRHWLDVISTIIHFYKWDFTHQLGFILFF